MLALKLTTCCLLIIAACGGNNTTPTGSKAPKTSLPMPPASNNTEAQQSFTLLDNRRAKLSDYTGQVVLLDFWATYCPPCLTETPRLVQLHQLYGQRGLTIIGLNVGGPDDKPKVADFVQQFKIPYALGYPDSEMQALFMSADDRIPQTYIFDRRGHLIKHFIGYDDTVRTELEEIIKKSLAE